MKLLLAEDEQALSRALVTILELNHYCVDVVYNGQDALDYLCTDHYDGAILDIMMPKLDGISVLKEIRSQGDATPVILLTAKSGIDDRVEGLDSGADDYLTKPFAMKELLARIRAMTRRNVTMTDTVLCFENLQLDRATYELKCGKHTLRMPNKEYQLLELLMLHPGTIISTEQFMSSIWGLNSDADINVVWVYLSRLRKTLVRVGASAQIRSSRGLGYYLEAHHD